MRRGTGGCHIKKPALLPEKPVQPGPHVGISVARGAVTAAVAQPARPGQERPDVVRLALDILDGYRSRSAWMAADYLTRFRLGWLTAARSAMPEDRRTLYAS